MRGRKRNTLDGTTARPSKPASLRCPPVHTIGERPLSKIDGLAATFVKLARPSHR